MKSGKFTEHLFRRLKWEDLDEGYLKNLVSLARKEDVLGAGLKEKFADPKDVTTDTLDASLQGRAKLVARKDLVLCGSNLVQIVLDVYSEESFLPKCKFVKSANDADFLSKGALIGEITGPSKVILQAERVLLNFLQHLSGVASTTKTYVDAISKFNTKLLDTRKTTPAFRVLEKYAVACGGAVNHRIGLFDRVMLKDNHLAASSSAAGKDLAEAVKRAKQLYPNLAIEVEVDSLEQIPPVLEAEADVIMFDNFSLEETKTGLALVGDKAWTECSGGINLDTISQIAALGPDFVSTGALIHKSTWIDIGLDWF